MYRPNYQPACSNPTSACVSNAAGYTMCSNCLSDPVLGPVWHKTEDFEKKIAKHHCIGVGCVFCLEARRLKGAK